MAYLRSHLRYWYFGAMRFIRGQSLDLPSINLLQEDFYHEGKKTLDTLGRMVGKIQQEGVTEESKVFLTATFKKFHSRYVSYRDQFFTIAPHLRNAFRLDLTINRLSRRISRLDSEKIGTKFAQQTDRELSEVQERLKHIFKEEFNSLFVTIEDTLKTSVENVRHEKEDILSRLTIRIVEEYEKTSKVLKLSYGQSDSWTKIFTNIIRNGVEAVEQATNEHPLDKDRRKVIIEYKSGNKQTESIEIAIKDTGIGMTEEVKQNFYKRGFTQGKAEGLGLGITESTIDYISKAGSLHIETRKNVGTEFKITIRPDRLENARFERENVFNRLAKSPALRIVGLSLILVVILSGIFFYDSIFWSEERNPVAVEINSSNSIVLKNARGKILNTVNFSQPVMFGWDSIDRKKRIVLHRIADIDNDSKNEVLVGLHYSEQSTGKIVCLNFEGNQLWEFDCGTPGIYNVNMGEDSPNGGIFTPGDIEAEDLDGDGNKEILIASQVDVYFVDQLVILNKEGKKLKEFWHPGGIGDIFMLDYDLDGKKEIGIHGINNRYGWRPILGFYDPNKIDGQAFPYCSIKDLRKALAEVYVVFPNIKKSLPAGDYWGNYTSAIFTMKCDSSGTGEYDYEIWLSDMRIYKLDSKFNLTGEPGFFPTGFKEWAQACHFEYPITEEDKENWKNIEVWINGVKRDDNSTR